MEPFIGQITLFPITYAPANWADCDGRLIPIAQNQALYSLIGTAYGGDGKTTFALPDLRGRAPVCFGVQPGGGNYLIGQRDGFEGVALTQETIPPHIHRMAATTNDGSTNSPGGMLLANVIGGALNETFSGWIYYQDQPGPGTQLSDKSVASAGGSMAHNNMQPSLVLRYCISLGGIYPQRPTPPSP